MSSASPARLHKNSNQHQMDLDEPIDLLRERAASSSAEPVSARPKPFDDDEDDQSSSRKRQRMETDNPEKLGSVRGATLNMSSPGPDHQILPTTPTRNANHTAETTPNSNQVTLNLRSTRDVELPSSSSPHSLSSPSRLPHAADSEPTIMDQSTEPEANATDIHQTIETPSSSLSSSGEPEVMLVESENEYFSDAQPAIAIIDDEIIAESEQGDQTYSFPFLEETDSLQDSALRLANYFELGTITGPSYFNKLRIWMTQYVRWARRNPEEAFKSYSETKDFWESIPEIIKALSLRKPHFGNWLKTDQTARDALSCLFQAFAMLASQFALMDARTLARCRDNPGSPVTFASRGFLDTLHYLLFQLEQEHIGQYLVNYYSWHWDHEICNMHANFERQGATMRIFIDSAKGYIDMGLQAPKVLENLREACRFVFLSLRFARLDTNFPAQEYARRVVLAYKLFEIMEEHLLTFIEKHATLLGADNVIAEIMTLSSILDFVLDAKHAPAEKRLQEVQQSDPDLPPKFLSQAAAYRWKYSMLTKLMTSAQMQLRVAATHHFCVDLVHVYGKRAPYSAEENPLLRNIAKFIVSAKLVDYIVGVGSHPEIIAQSKDVIGFLAVTKTYENHHTDKIWSTVKSSQDPRVVESVLALIRGMLNLLEHKDRIYLCIKLQEIPVESFTIAMRSFCDELFKLLRQEAKQGLLDLEGPPYDVCVRLICESTLQRADLSTAFNEVQQWASGQFEFLTKHDRQYTSSPDTAVRRQIYQRCLDDLRGGKTAEGSLLALGILVEANLPDLRQLIGEPDFIHLLIENFSWKRSSNSVNKHLRLFQRIIEMDFIKDSSKFGLQLWNKIIGAEEADLDGAECHLGWKMLSVVMKDVKPTKKENVFIKACIQQYLPSLPPHLFSKASFNFAREALDIGEFEKYQDGEPAIDAKGVEQLWRMVLTGHDNPAFQTYAINELIRFYLDSATITSLPSDKILEIHLAFVDRCLSQLTSAAGKLKSFSEGTTSGDDEPMIIVMPDEEVHGQESLFCRSLFLLKGFLRAYETSARFGQTQVQPQLISPPESMQGELMDVSYQVFDDKTNSPVRKLTVGKLNTGMFLFGSLQKAAGFKPIRVHHCGREVTSVEFDLSKSLEELRLGTHLVLVSPKPNPGPWNERSPVQLEVMKRFDDLFELLVMEGGTQAKDIYEFLVWFPAYDKLLNALSSENTPYEELFPAQHPYKTLFTMHTLQILIAEQLKSQPSDQSVKLRCFGLLVESITSHEYLDTRTDEDYKLCFFMQLFESVSHFLTDSSLRDHLALTVDSQVLLERVMVLLSDCLKSSSRLSSSLLFKVFWAVMAFSTWSLGFWAKFKTHPRTPEVVERILLTKFDTPPNHAWSPFNSIARVCSANTSSAPVDTLEFLQFFWPLLVGLVPKATLHPECCEPAMFLIQQVLRVAVEVSAATEVSINGLDLIALASQWGQLLITHEVIQYVGRPAVVDHVALGLANLLHSCVHHIIPATLDPLRPMAHELFAKHLFLDLPSESDDTTLEEPHLPVLDTATRQLIVDTIMMLIKDDMQNYMYLMKLVTALVPHPPEDGDYIIDMTQSFERSRVIRSATGYVGLKNLSNTCYLNSLMTQLFMNVSFREFMLNARVADDSSQKLLYETQKLFGRMQNSLKKWADPQELALSIRTYEDSNIDVTIQMDVDEFYNLLFDRWEGQMLAPDAKATFRSFYGGQLVQQVKSKECDHISERLEPFSAIQCDIKGKASLKESLQAYVNGEIMEGDNKYKCSTCDQHVDAVKRACLKDVPDNLIFHLKRFDYNLREGRRNKLNDYFSFPNDIDMRPYKVDYLTQGPEGCVEDMFELVGVLVHSGTAESGHYYSYIRERPAENSKCWVEFNDDHVTAFDPSNIEASCFGGSNYQPTNDFQFDKNYSAYMLFYQRRSSLVEQKQKLGHLLGPEPIKLPISQSETLLINHENALQLHKYVLYDPSHASLVKQLFARLNHESGESLSNHVLEDQALDMTLNHMDQVFGRTKDTPDFQSFVLMLRSMFENCSTCSERFLHWIANSPDACRHYMAKSPDAVVRGGIADLILVALKTLKRDAPNIYGLGHDHQRPIPSKRRLSDDQFEDALHELNASNKVFGRVVEAVCRQWDLVLSNLRAWPEYFDLVGGMMDGVLEIALLMDNGLFGKTTEIIMASWNVEPTPEIVRMLTSISKRSPNRIVHYDLVVALMEKFLGVLVTLGSTPEARPFRTDQALHQWPLTTWPRESHLLSLHWTQCRDNIFVGELLKLNVNEPATQSILQRLLMKLEDDGRGLAKQIGIAISEGLSRNHLSYPPGSFLKGALTFCRYTDDDRLFKDMVYAVKKNTLDSELYGGSHYLQFFKDLMDLPDNKIEMPVTEIHEFAIKNIPEWAPSLLVNYDPNCRTATEEYISRIVFRVDQIDTDEFGSLCDQIAKDLGIKCLEHLEHYFIRPNVQVLKPHLASIKTVSDACKSYFEDGSEQQARYLNFHHSVWSNIQRCAVTHLDDEGSAGSDDWEQSDGELSTSSILNEDQDPLSLVDNTVDL